LPWSGSQTHRDPYYRVLCFMIGRDLINIVVYSDFVEEVS
jgi:hypothetical protein